MYAMIGMSGYLQGLGSEQTLEIQQRFVISMDNAKSGIYDRALNDEAMAYKTLQASCQSLIVSSAG